jgi:hypothetical protein
MYWNNTHGNTVDLSALGHYADFDHMTATTPEGYRCDSLQPSPMIFLGSCDMNGPIEDSNRVWSKLLHDKLSLDNPIPYIALGKVHISFISVVRRLYTFCKKYGPPKQVFIVVPRPAALEIPLYDNTLINLSERNPLPKFLHKFGKIGVDELKMTDQVVNFVKSQSNSTSYHLYQFEHASAFLETICERYGIELRWTPNLSVSAVSYYAEYFPTFMEENDFMRSTCAGIALLEDFAFDGSMGMKSQHRVCELFMKNSGEVNMDLALRNATQNINFVAMVHADKLEMSRGG